MTEIYVQCAECKQQRLVKKMTIEHYIGNNFGQLSMSAELECGHVREMSHIIH